MLDFSLLLVWVGQVFLFFSPWWRAESSRKVKNMADCVILISMK